MYQENNYEESKSSKKLIISIILILLLISSGTYAFLVFQGIENTTATQVGCFEVNYSAQEINASELVSTTSYLEGAHTTVSLSKNANCPVYTEASIYAHTNDTTTAPINEVQALKYKVLLSGETIKEGVITNISNNDTKLATVELTTDIKNYDIYIWIDSDISGGAYNQTTYSGYIYAESTQASTVTDFTTAVTLSNAISDASIDFSKTSEESGTNGLYVRSGTENDEYPIYYYRGAVDNNLIFANFCWKIVRTTETGGLKLIYNGIPTNGTCNNTGEASQIGTSAFNSNYSSLAYNGYMYGTVYGYLSKNPNSDTTEYVYGNDVSYENGTYTLTGETTSGQLSDLYNSGLNNYHYTCFSASTTCSETNGKVYYIFQVGESGIYADYITLKDGKKIEDALSEMLDYNTESSTIKGNNTTEGTLDYWYYTNLYTNYNSYIEDTVWCYDRSISQLNGWNPNGGDLTKMLYFSPRERVYVTYTPDLTCKRDIDKFTVDTANGNGDLDYPVGLLTSDEVMLAGGKYNTSNNSYYLYSNSDYWLGSPGRLDGDNAVNFAITSLDWFRQKSVESPYGVRPSISLAKGYNIISGDGKVDNPYIVDAPPITS